MKMLTSFLSLFILFFSQSIYANDNIAVYGAEITNQDRYNSSGERLTTVKQILRQDRTNFYMDNGSRLDEADGFFSTKTRRELFDNAKININPWLARKILGNQRVLITVDVLSSDEIDVKSGLP